MSYTVPYTVDCEGVLAHARANRWSVERYAQCFHDMPHTVAYDLLNGMLEITPEGTVYDPCPHPSTPEEIAECASES